jgi:hypothetical protein
MKSVMIAGLLVAASLVGGTTAFAQRDGADRTQRLDSEEFRNDIGQERLKVPSHPLIIAPPQQPAATSKGTKGKKSSASGSH